MSSACKEDRKRETGRKKNRNRRNRKRNKRKRSCPVFQRRRPPSPPCLISLSDKKRKETQHQLADIILPEMNKSPFSSFFGLSSCAPPPAQWLLRHPRSPFSHLTAYTAHSLHREFHRRENARTRESSFSVSTDRRANRPTGRQERESREGRQEDW